MQNLYFRPIFAPKKKLKTDTEKDKFKNAHAFEV